MRCARGCVPPVAPCMVLRHRLLALEMHNQAKHKASARVSRVSAMATRPSALRTVTFGFCGCLLALVVALAALFATNTQSEVPARRVRLTDACGSSHAGVAEAPRAIGHGSRSGDRELSDARFISPSSDKVGAADLASTDDRLWDVAPCPL